MSQTLFTNVMVLDGSGAAPFAGEVLIEGNRIKAVAKASEPIRAADVETVDGGGATLMPGLVEAHAHPSFGNTSTLEALGDIPPEEHLLMTMKHVRLLLDHGFTSICSAASAKPRLDIVIRNAIEAGDIPGPRMLAATPELTVTGGLGDVRLHHLHRETFAVICDGPDEFRRAARHFVREGVDTLKINPAGDEFVPAARAKHTVMNEAEVAAVCEVGRSRGRRVAAHARSAESVKMCVRNGVDIVYHATLRCGGARHAGIRQGDGLRRADARRHLYDPP
jgi:imidazolonepropionase-like amidohydrolase